MTTDPTSEVPVLVAGAGPAGLTAAITLARAGVEVLVVERRTASSGLPKATALTTRTMELFRSWGLEDGVRARGVDVDWLLWRCETLAGAHAGEGFSIGMPTTAQSRVLSPTAPGCVPQDLLEPLLLEHLRSLPGARVALGTEVVGLEHTAGGVRVTLRDVATGETRAVAAVHVVGADGARSAVRRLLEVAMRGPERLLDGMATVFRAPLWELVGDRRFGIYGITHPEADGAVLPAGPGDRWGYGAMWEPGSRERPDEGGLLRLIRLAAGVPDLPITLERTMPFSAGVQLAERFRVGEAFLIGDAAHRVTPRGGTGMNTAIHDGHDIGWKLTWVHRGWASRELLDSYEAERRPVAEHNAARSADPDGSVRDVAETLHADLAGRVPHAWVAPGVSSVDLLGPGLTVYAGRDAAAWERAAAGAPLPIHVRDVGEIAARGLGVRAGGALVARPDGLPVALLNAPGALAETVRAVRGRSRLRAAA